MEALTHLINTFSVHALKLGGVQIQRGRDQKSLHSCNPQLDDAGCSPANQRWVTGFMEGVSGSHGATEPVSALLRSAGAEKR